MGGPQSETAVGADARPPRRHDVDWLRIAAVLLLIPYHTARVFNWEEQFYVKNDPTSDAAQWFVDVVGNWHMSLLFLLAGAATWLAFRHRGALQYAGERARRLLVPFVFGLAVVVPPQSWLAYRWHGGGDVSFWEYYPRFWTTADPDLEGYEGGFTPGHLWFILALFGFSLVGLPLFLWLRRSGSGARVLRGFGRLAQVPGLLVLVPALVLVLPWYVMNDDLSGQSPVGFFVVVLLGFMLFGDERIEQAIDRQWVWLLLLGAVLVVGFVWVSPRADDLWRSAGGAFGLRLFYEIGVWSVMLGLLGLGHRYLVHGGRVLAYATEAAYPFYILHQTTIVAVAYVVCGWGWPVWAKFTLIAVVSLIVTVGVYELVVRRWAPVRFLFGMKARRRAAGAAAVPPAPPRPATPFASRETGA